MSASSKITRPRTNSTSSAESPGRRTAANLPTIGFPESRPSREALLDPRLRPLALGRIEGAPLDSIGEIVLAGEAFLGLGVVTIALAVAQILHQPGGRVEDMSRRRERACFPGHGAGGTERLVDGHRLRGCGHVHGDLGQR